MDADILVSVIAPVYNGEKTLERCVDSLTKQTWKNIEIILVDDGSKDRSFAICEKLAARDARVKAFRVENRGSGPARNYGIERARGKYLYFPDSDDLVDERAIEILVDAIETSGADLVVFGYRRVDGDGKKRSTKIFPNQIVDGAVARATYSDYLPAIQGAPWNKFFKRDLTVKYGIEYPPLRRHQDEAFIARYVARVEKIQFIDDALYTYFANDLKREWEKYPTTYVDAVIGLYEDRKRNMLTWNENDAKLRDQVRVGFICGVVKALELSFSPKFKFNKKERLKWIEESIKKSGVLATPTPESLGKYQKFAVKLMAKKAFRRLYSLLRFKVWIERNGWLSVVK